MRDAEPEGATGEEVDVDQVETMARAMCQADGHEPDERVVVPGLSETAPDGRPTPGGPVPRWRVYAPHARKLVAAQQALLEER